MIGILLGLRNSNAKIFWLKPEDVVTYEANFIQCCLTSLS